MRRVRELEKALQDFYAVISAVCEPYNEAAESVARAAHAGQFRRDGVTPYIVHPAAVAAAVPAPARSVAWLHDVIEDNPAQGRKLIEEARFPPVILDAVEALTKKKGVPYEEYLRGIKENETARIVKIADIKHNLSDDPTPKQVEKYTKALAFLEVAP